MPGEGAGCRGRSRCGSRCAGELWGITILVSCPERAKLREQHVIWRLVLRVILEHGPLEILDCIGVPVQVALLLKLAGDGEALLSQTAVCLPVGQKPTAHRLARFREGLAIGLLPLLRQRL